MSNRKMSSKIIFIQYNSGWQWNEWTASTPINTDGPRRHISGKRSDRGGICVVWAQLSKVCEQASRILNVNLFRETQVGGTYRKRRKGVMTTEVRLGSLWHRRVEAHSERRHELSSWRRSHVCLFHYNPPVAHLPLYHPSEWGLCLTVLSIYKNYILFKITYILSRVREKFFL